MKKIIFFFAIALFVCISCRQTKINALNNEESNLYRVKKIKVKKSLYIIHAVRNDSIFKIISDRDVSHNKNCEKIKTRNSYHFDLERAFRTDSLFGLGVVEKIGIIRVYRDYNIQFDKKFHYRIYTAKNLEGLCLMKPN